MNKKLAASAFAAIALVGCFDGGPASPTASPAENPQPTQSAALRTTGSGGPIQSYAETQSNGGSAVERFADCPLGMVLTGFGGRVYNDNFTGVTVHCRNVEANGNLGGESTYEVGSGGQETSLTLPYGMVATGVGGVVNSGNLIRVKIRGCEWVPSTRKLNTANCQDYHSSSTGAEVFHDAWINISDGAIKARTIATGAGMTSSNNNVHAVRLTVGTLAP